MLTHMNENTITGEIVDAAYKVHAVLGPGLLESVYEAALSWELEKRGLRVSRQQGIPVIYEQVHIHTGFFADLIVENQIIVEIKATDVIAPVHKRQLLTYLKLADKRLGLLINFNVALIKNGIIRIANGLKE
jgi:GxxExxY protein